MLDPAQDQLVRTLGEALAKVAHLGGIVEPLLRAARLRGFPIQVLDLALEPAAETRATRSALGLTAES